MGDIGSTEIFSKTPLTAPLPPDTVRLGSSNHARHQRISTHKGFFHIEGRPDTLPYGEPVIPMYPQPSTIKRQVPVISVEGQIASELQKQPENKKPNQFIPWLKKSMKERNRTQRSLAEATGINHSSISRLLSEVEREPGIATVARMVEFFARNSGENYDREVYDMIVSHAPGEIKQDQKRGVLPVGTPVLTGTPREQLDGYIGLSKISNRALASRIGMDQSSISKLRIFDRLPKLEAFARLVVGLELTPEQARGYLKAVVNGKTGPEDVITKNPTPESQTHIHEKPTVISVEKSSASSSKVEPEGEPVWVRYDRITPEIFGDIVSIYENIFGVLPTGRADFSRLIDITTEKGLARWTKSPDPEYKSQALEAVRTGEKGEYIRFKAYIPGITGTNTQGIQNVRIFQRRVDEYLRKTGLAVETRKAISQSIVQPYSSEEIVQNRTERLNAFRAREPQILWMISKGFSNAQIAEELGIDVDNIASAIGRIKKRLGVSSKEEAVRQVLGVSPVVLKRSDYKRPRKEEAA